ncbi:MAG: PorT family protein [Crocinitomicaceae bacterium]|nr:PorT family protein [Crocinitomicaceae bacterium]
MESKEGFLGEKFTGYGVAPADGVWSGIEATLDKEEKKRRAIIWWFTSAAAGIAILFSALNLSHNSVQRVQNEVRARGNNDWDKIVLLGLRDEYKKEELKEVYKESIGNKGEDARDYGHRIIEITESEESRRFYENITGTEFEFAELEEKQIIDQEPMFMDNLSKLPALEEGRLDINYANINPSVSIDKPKNSTRWFHEISMNGWNNSDKSGLGFSLVEENELADMLDSSSVAVSSPDPVITVENRIKPIGVNYHLGVELGKRFELRSGLGLNYFLLSKKNDGILASRTHQLSLAIPLSFRVNYGIKKPFQFFTDAGAVIEAPVFTRTKSLIPTSTLFSESTGTSSFNLTPGIAGKIGVKYMLDEKRCISLSPEIRYYFNSNNLANATGSNKPLWLGLDLAYRF